MKAIERFNNTMERCNQLVWNFKSLPKGNDDLLRFAIVLAISAFERYVKDAFLEHIVQFDRMPKLHREQRAEFDSFINEAGVDPDIWRECYLNRNKCRHPRQTIRNTVRRHLSKEPIQTHEKISNLFKHYGLGNILQSAGAKTDKVLIWKKIEKLINRRHQIAHASDYQTMGKLEPIDEKWVSRQLNALSRFVGCMEDIIQNKFSRKKKSKSTKTRKSISH